MGTEDKPSPTLVIRNTPQAVIKQSADGSITLGFFLEGQIQEQGVLSITMMPGDGLRLAEGLRKVSAGNSKEEKVSLQ